MRRGVAALLQRVAVTRTVQQAASRAHAAAAGSGERVARSLDDVAAGAASELDLSAAGAPHADLVCVNIMCERVRARLAARRV
jgi:hypothetical protein